MEDLLLTLCDQGGYKLVPGMMQTRLEKDNESCWSQTVESTGTAVDCKPEERDCSLDALWMGRPQYAVGFPGFGRDGAPALTELKGEGWKVPAFSLPAETEVELGHGYGITLSRSWCGAEAAALQASAVAPCACNCLWLPHGLLQQA